MTHKMILATADLSKIYRIVVATRKTESAGVAQVAEHGIRIPEGEISSISTSPKFDERE